MIESRIFLCLLTSLTVLIIWMVFLGVTMAYGPTFSSQFSFVVANDRQFENVIVSPSSVRTALAWLFMGADDTTAAEIKIEAQLNGYDSEEVATNFGNQRQTQKHRQRQRQGSLNEGTTFEVSNALFIDDKFEIRPEFMKISHKYFNAIARNMNFLESEHVAETINKWTERHTNDYVKNIVTAKDFSNKNTTAIVLNSSTFNAKWQHRFNVKLTRKMLFYCSDGRKSIVDMMWQANLFPFGRFPEVGAEVIELPFQRSNITMFILLPMKWRSVSFVEKSMAHLSFFYFKSRMKLEKMLIFLPKFQLNFSLPIKPILTELGMNTMFTREANFKKLVDHHEEFSVTEFWHNAFINVHEYGIGEKSFEDQKSLEKMDLNATGIFKVDRPFVLTIRDNVNVYYSGHLAVL